MFNQIKEMKEELERCKKIDKELVFFENFDIKSEKVSFAFQNKFKIIKLTESLKFLEMKYKERRDLEKLAEVKLSKQRRRL